MIENLKLFVLIVEKGGMAAAGRELGMSPATVSARLASMEREFGARLLNRTTRSLSPTSEGLILLEGARRVLAEVQELEARVRWGGETLTGVIKLSAPLDLGQHWLVPLLDGFLDEHPELHIDLHLSDGYVDVIGGGFDVVLRYGVLLDSTLRARKIATIPRVVCAAPSYLQRYGEPVHPEELAQHNCLLMRFGHELANHWLFVEEKQEYRVTVKGNRTSNHGELVRRWCLDGHGIARKSMADVAKDLDAGRLVRLLEPFESVPLTLQLVYPGGYAPARRVKLLMDHLFVASASLAA